GDVVGEIVGLAAIGCGGLGLVGREDHLVVVRGRGLGLVDGLLGGAPLRRLVGGRSRVGRDAERGARVGRTTAQGHGDRPHAATQHEQGGAHRALRGGPRGGGGHRVVVVVRDVV